MKQDIKWIYVHKIGIIEIWAKSEQEVVEILKYHGFLNVDVSKIKQAPVYSNDPSDIRNYDR